jgi:membrane-associated protease RseP (regulator of RpoE activity)
MRSAVGSLLLMSAVAASTTASASPSNPAFLGISFGQSPTGHALIQTVTADSPAARAGLLPGDDVVGVENNPVDMQTLNGYIIAHEPGDTIKMRILRHGTEYLELTPTLTTRAAMFDHLLGHTFPAVPLADSDSEDAVELGEPSGHATVIAWYERLGGGGNCIDPVPIIEKVAQRVSAVPHSTASVVAATCPAQNDVHSTIASDRKRLGLPVLITNESDFGSVAIAECGRVFAMVLDAHGVVTFLSPISDGDDEDATLDEIATAAAQADHKRH